MSKTSKSRSTKTVYILEKSKIKQNKEKVLFFTSMGDHMKGILTKIWKKGRDSNFFPMDQCTKEISFRATKKAKVFLNGPMDKFMTDNGKEVKKMAVECGKEMMEIHILDNGKQEKLRDLESLFPKKEIDMKVNSKIQWSMVSAQKDMFLEIHTLDYFQKIDQMGKENFIIKMVTTTKEIFQMDWDMEMVFWGRIMATLIWESLEMTRDVDLGNIQPKKEKNMLVTLKTIWNMGMEKFMEMGLQWQKVIGWVIKR